MGREQYERVGVGLSGYQCGNTCCGVRYCGQSVQGSRTNLLKLLGDEKEVA